MLFVSLAMAGPTTALVGFTGDPLELHTEAEGLGGSPGHCFHKAGICILEFQADPPIEALSVLAGVRYVERDALMVPLLKMPDVGQRIAGTVDCPDLWELEKIRLEEAWALSEGADFPVIAIQDGGFLLSHQDLLGTVSGQFDYGNGDTVPEVELSVGVPGHGTFIAGMLAALSDNELGRVGIVPGGRLNLEKIADSSGAFYWSYAIAAMSDIADGDLGIKVLNYSISSSSFYQAFYESVAALEAVGVVVVAAAANCDVENCRDGNNDEFPVYPANFELPHILSVAGSTQDDSLNSYSHYGPQTVDLAAPGVDLCSLDISSNTATITASGTSYATPIVAGVVAIVQGVFPELTPAEVVRVIRASAKPVAGLSGKVLSGGRLDVAAALEMAVPRLLEPEDGMGTLGIVNVGASGKASLVIFIEGVEILGAEGWEFKNFEQGEMLRLPEGGELVAPMGGAVLTQNLEPGESRAVLELRAVETGVFSGTVRAVMESSGVMQSPIDAGIEDPSGEWAWEFTVRVEAKDSASQNSEAKEEAPACGCQSGSASLLLLLGALSRGLSRGRV